MALPAHKPLTSLLAEALGVTILTTVLTLGGLHLYLAAPAAVVAPPPVTHEAPIPTPTSGPQHIRPCLIPEGCYVHRGQP